MKKIITLFVILFSFMSVSVFANEQVSQNFKDRAGHTCNATMKVDKTRTGTSQLGFMYTVEVTLDMPKEDLSDHISYVVNCDKWHNRSAYLHANGWKGKTASIEYANSSETYVVTYDKSQVSDDRVTVNFIVSGILTLPQQNNGEDTTFSMSIFNPTVMNPEYGQPVIMSLDYSSTGNQRGASQTNLCGVQANILADYTTGSKKEVTTSSETKSTEVTTEAKPKQKMLSDHKEEHKDSKLPTVIAISVSAVSGFLGGRLLLKKAKH